MMISKVILVYKLAITLEHYEFNKLIKNGNILKIYDGLSLEEKALLVSRKYGKNVSFFVKRMKEVKPNLILWNLEDNIEKLKIRECLSYSKFLDGAVATYSPDDNLIKLKMKYRSTIYHELMHTSSSYIAEDGTVMSGFRQFMALVKDIGRGLNEGYTELLTERYFFDQCDLDTYGILVCFAKDIESIVGKEQMEKLYFSASLYGLKEEIIKYTTEEEFIQFLEDLDWLYYNENGEGLELITRFQRMGNFVYLTYIKKCRRLLNIGQISMEECKNRINRVIWNVKYVYYENGNATIWKCDKKKMVEELNKIGVFDPSIESVHIEDKNLYDILKKSQEEKEQAKQAIKRF